jgi:peptide/nickel transport system permease protein
MLLLHALLKLLLVVLGVTSLTFLLLHLVPGDPVEVILGEQATAADREALRQALGLDQPLLQQWLESHLRLLSGDWGLSLHSRLPVLALIGERLFATVALAVTGLLLALALALPGGVLTAFSPKARTSRVVNGLVLLLLSTPTFVIALLLTLLLAVELGWVPVSGMDSALSWVAPTLTIGLAIAPALTRMVNAAVADCLREPWVRTAQAKGLSRRAVLLNHVLLPASLPVLTLLGMQFGALLGGAVITEVCFGWPGLGSLLLEAIQRRDYPLVQGCVLVTSLMYVLVSRGVEWLAAWLDPRGFGAE